MGHTHQCPLSEPIVISDRYDLEGDLPQVYQLRSFSSYSTPKQLQNAVKLIHDQLEQNDWQGNQWLVIKELYTNDQPALREFFQIDSPQNVANGLEGSTGSLGLLNALRLEEDRQSYPWGYRAHAFLLEVTKRSGKWPEVLTKPARTLLKMIEAWFFEVPSAENCRRLQGKRIVHWALPADLLATLTHFMDGIGAHQRFNESCEVEYPTAL
ncbi:hypothetical protein BDV39DRAFT_200582 [Aspergillus sergii]|uniref:Uncharacterized protein n=1 Tax=Aspergillus sergii TaxID=1034303 RepID=A0A5N6XFA8_9EURO|nr:hypothetical protein BDV39DRAFT_200582 [Aspergillus sergii]